MRTSILDTRVMRGADVYSEHYLVKTRICLKLARAEGRKNVRERFDVSKLQSEETKNYLEKDGQERAKQSWVEKLGSKQSDCTRQSVSQTAWRNYAPSGAIRLDDDHDNNSSVWKDEVKILMCIKKRQNYNV